MNCTRCWGSVISQDENHRENHTLENPARDGPSPWVDFFRHQWHCNSQQLFSLEAVQRHLVSTPTTERCECLIFGHNDVYPMMDSRSEQRSPLLLSWSLEDDAKEKSPEAALQNEVIRHRKAFWEKFKGHEEHLRRHLYREYDVKRWRESSRQASTNEIQATFRHSFDPGCKQSTSASHRGQGILPAYSMPQKFEGMFQDEPVQKPRRDSGADDEDKVPERNAISSIENGKYNTEDEESDTMTNKDKKVLSVEKENTGCSRESPKAEQELSENNRTVSEPVDPNVQGDAKMAGLHTWEETARLGLSPKTLPEKSLILPAKNGDMKLKESTKPWERNDDISLSSSDDSSYSTMMTSNAHDVKDTISRLDVTQPRCNGGFSNSYPGRGFLHFGDKGAWPGAQGIWKGAYGPWAEASPRKQYQCTYCGKVYCRKYVLKIHMRTHTGYKPLQCPYCEKSFSDPSNMKKHVKLHENQDQVYICDYCGRNFVRYRGLLNHIKCKHFLTPGYDIPSMPVAEAGKY